MEAIGGCFALAIWLGGLVLSVFLIVAQLRLFKIDATLKEILAELKRQNSPSVSAPTAETQSLEETRARIADVQKNWPTYE